MYGLTYHQLLAEFTYQLGENVELLSGHMSLTLCVYCANHHLGVEPLQSYD
jgi:hypothetical protein